MLKGICTAIVVALCSVGAFAQDRTASVTGTVKDPTGAPVAGASITVRNTATGIKHVAQTSASGDYTITALNPGTYDTLVEHPGFASIQRAGILLHVDDVVRLDYSLTLGEVTQVIDVKEDVPLLRTSDAAL